MRKSLLVLLVAALAISTSANAEEHRLFPKSVNQIGEAAFPYVIYEYTQDDSGGVGVRIDLSVEAEYFPTEGVFYTSRGGVVDVKELTFHQIVGYDNIPFLDPVTRFNQRYTIEYLKGSGGYTFDVVFTNGESETSARFTGYFPTFEPVESTCRVDEETIAFDFTIWSMENLPDSVDTITVMFPDRDVSVHEMKFTHSWGGFGWVSIPLDQRLYEKALAGQKLTTRWTIAGETVEKIVYFPPVSHVRVTCQRG